jgi:hypothetical protein
MLFDVASRQGLDRTGRRPIAGLVERNTEGGDVTNAAQPTRGKETRSASPIPAIDRDGRSGTSAGLRLRNRSAVGLDEPT